MTVSSVVHRVDPDKSIRAAAAAVTDMAIESAMHKRIVTKSLGQLLRAKLREATKDDQVVERLRIIFQEATDPDVIMAKAAVGVFNNYAMAANRAIDFSATDRGPSKHYVPVVYGGAFKVAAKTVGYGRDLGKDHIVVGVPDFLPGNIMVTKDPSLACTHQDHILLTYSREHKAWVEEMSRGDVYLEERLSPMDFARLMVYLTTAY